MAVQQVSGNKNYFCSQDTEALLKQLNSGVDGSVVPATLIVMVVRTRKVIFTSKPGKYLLFFNCICCVVCIAASIEAIRRAFRFYHCAI